MGGYGSGRWQVGKDITIDYPVLDVRQLQRENLLSPGNELRFNCARGGKSVAFARIRIEASWLILNYPVGDWHSMQQRVGLIWTPCVFGGRRYWFICPEKVCRRRVELLYLGPKELFACRRCYGLAHVSQREHRHDRAARRANKIRRRLGWEPGFMNGYGPKPKGMHWRTFERLKAEHDAFVEVALDWVKRRLDGPHAG